MLKISFAFLLFFTLIMFGKGDIVYGSDSVSFSAPLYWSVYEYHYLKEEEPNLPDDQNYISEADLMKNVDWVEENLLDYGYDMIALDGWGDTSQFNEYGYRTSHSRYWEHDYEWWAKHLEERGMQLGMYDNPLWVNMEAVRQGVKIKGTDIPLEDIIDEEEDSTWFTWVQVDQEGAEEYVKGMVQHYADMGIHYLNVDFLSWFEDGFDKNMGDVGPERPKEHYETALRWISEAAAENDILFKAVMPHLKDEAEVEREYADMIRINEDVAEGGWFRFSQDNRGNRRDYWSQWANPMDGYAYWSHISGRNKLILCGDFIRLNTFNLEDEKKSVISQHLIAGGPLGVADQQDTIGDNLEYYQNEEMLELNYDGFVGKPLSNDPANIKSQIWKGEMSNGDWVVALFNRENVEATREIDFSRELDIEGEAEVRDLWKHKDLGTMKSFSEKVPPRGVIVLKIVP